MPDLEKRLEAAAKAILFKSKSVLHRALGGKGDWKDADTLWQKANDAERAWATEEARAAIMAFQAGAPEMLILNGFGDREWLGDMPDGTYVLTEKVTDA